MHIFSEKCIKSNYGGDIDILNDINNIRGSKHKSTESSIEKCMKPYGEEITKGITGIFKFFLIIFMIHYIVYRAYLQVKH